MCATIRENESREVTVRFCMSDILVLERKSKNESWERLDASDWNLPEFNFSIEWDPTKRRSVRKIFEEYSPIKGPRESERTESVEKSPSKESRESERNESAENSPHRDCSQLQHGRGLCAY